MFLRRKRTDEVWCLYNTSRFRFSTCVYVFHIKFNHSGILYILFSHIRHEFNSINNRLYVVLSFVDSLLSWITGIGKNKDSTNMFYISNTDYTCFMYMFPSLYIFYIYLSWSVFVGNLPCTRLWNDHFTYLTCFTSQEVWFFLL